MSFDEARSLRNLQRRVMRARKSMQVTCPASRHLHMIADALAAGRPYPMLEEEPKHCAETMYSVLESLWKLRTARARGARGEAPDCRATPPDLGEHGTGGIRKIWEGLLADAPPLKE